MDGLTTGERAELQRLQERMFAPGGTVSDADAARLTALRALAAVPPAPQVPPTQQNPEPAPLVPPRPPLVPPRPPAPAGAPQRPSSGSAHPQPQNAQDAAPHAVLTPAPARKSPGPLLWQRMLAVPLRDRVIPLLASFTIIAVTAAIWAVAYAATTPMPLAVSEPRPLKPSEIRELPEDLPFSGFNATIYAIEGAPGVKAYIAESKETHCVLTIPTYDTTDLPMSNYMTECQAPGVPIILSYYTATMPGYEASEDEIRDYLGSNQIHIVFSHGVASVWDRLPSNREAY